MNTTSPLAVPLGVLLSLLAGTAVPLHALRTAFPGAIVADITPPSPKTLLADDLDSRVNAVVADSAGRLTLSSFGTSKQGKPLHLLRLGDENKPAILIVAGLNPQHRVGIDTALGVAKKLASLSGPDAASLADVCIYVIPCANPDGLERERTASVKRDGATNPAPWDDDADGRVDEDGPIDLNGDGVISMMRVPDPSPAYSLEATDIRDPQDPRLTRRADRAKGERPEFAIVVEGKDQDGDGLLAEDGVDGTDLARNFPYRWPEFQPGAGPSALCEPETRALAQWIVGKPGLVGVFVFGTYDNVVNVPEAGKFDQTQRVPTGIENEDKAVWDDFSKIFKDATGITAVPAGANDNAGTLHGWTYAFLGIWSFSNPVWVRPDLVTRPESKPAEPAGGGAPNAAPPPSASTPPAANAPISDAEVTTMIERFRTATPEQRREMMQQAMSLPPETQEKLRAAAMAAFAGQIPDVAPPSAASSQPAAQPPAQPVAPPAGQPAGGPPDGPRGPRGGPGGPGGRGGRGGRGGPGGAGPGGGGGPAAAPAAASSGDDAKWLKYSDDKRDKSGFIEFKPFNHPQLGTVEIGGFVPGFKLNPPEADEAPLVDQQAKFITQFIAKLPKLSVSDPWVEDLGGGLWRIGLRISNEGSLPTRSALALKARRLPPLRVVLDAPEDAVLVGQRTVRINNLAANGDGRTIEWTVMQPSGGNVSISIKSPEFGDQTRSIPLTPTPRVQKVPAPPPPPPPPVPPPSAAKPNDAKPAEATPAADKPAPKDPQEGSR